MNKSGPARQRAEVVIGGAGFAGLALAIALRQGLGDTFTVTVVDPGWRIPNQRTRAPRQLRPPRDGSLRRLKCGMRLRPTRSQSSTWW